MAALTSHADELCERFNGPQTARDATLDIAAQIEAVDDPDALLEAMRVQCPDNFALFLTSLRAENLSSELVKTVSVETHQCGAERASGTVSHTRPVPTSVAVRLDLVDGEGNPRKVTTLVLAVPVNEEAAWSLTWTGEAVDCVAWAEGAYPVP